MKKLLTFILLTLQLSAGFLPYEYEALKEESPEVLIFRVNTMEVKDFMLNEEIMVVQATVVSVGLSESNLVVGSNISIVYSHPLWQGHFNMSTLPLLEESVSYQGYLQYDAHLKAYMPSAKNQSFKLLNWE